MQATWHRTGMPPGLRPDPRSFASRNSRSRTDGPQKLSGHARYAGDTQLAGMVHAVLVQSPVASARILRTETAAARQAPGVLAVYTDAVFAPGLAALQPPPEAFTANFPSERRAPLSDRTIHYAGQHVALVVAATLEEARAAAALVGVEYELLPAELTLRPGLPGTYAPDHFATNSLEKLNSTRGNRPVEPAASVAAAFHTPVVHHNPMEPSATVALWKGDRLTLYDSTRWVQGSQKVIAHMLGISPEQVQVVAPFLGGAFGSKGFLWQHVALAAQAARVLQRPVKLVLTRNEMFTSTGHRPETLQHVTLEADAAGSLLGAEHHSLMDTSPVAHFVEPCGMTTRNLYATSYAVISHQVAPIHRASPCFMRAPGESPGMFALEVAMDELAEQLGIDPVALRVRNDTPEDVEEKRPFSSRHLRECLERGAELFGWSERDPKPRSMRRPDGKLRGLGMATAAYPARRSPASVRGVLAPDGSATFFAATHEIGCGTATVMEQVAADALGWPAGQVHFLLGDSAYPEAPVAGASQTVATVSPAVEAAAAQLRAALVAQAVGDPGSPLHGVPPESVVLREGVLCSGGRHEAAADLLARRGEAITCTSRTETGPGAKQEYTFHSFGAHFAEVSWDPAAAELRVTRWVSVMDCGRVLNPVTARSQIQGGVLFGMGMTLFEQTHYDPRTGAPVNGNLAEYHLPTCADSPEFTVEFLEYPDLHLNPLGVRGIGEIGITGVAAALANAIHHATGVRMHELPITPDKLLLSGA